MIPDIQKPLVIPIFIPHRGCPHKCAFCNQSIITSEKEILPDEKKIRQEVDTYQSYRKNRSFVELAFFGGNFLGLAPGETEKLLLIARELKREKRIDSIRCSTRPDTISQKSLDMASELSLTTVELGVQSMDDEVLSSARRGHTARDTEKAAKLLDDYKIKMGMQMMVGLPGDTDAKAIKTAREIAALGPAFVRIYPLMVLKQSLVHHWYTQKEYTPISLDHCVDLVATLYQIFEDKKIPVIRMGLQASESLKEDDTIVAGPWHPAFGHLVFSRMMLTQTLNKLDLLPKAKESSTITLMVNTSTESRLRGNLNQNMKHLAKLYPKAIFRIKADPFVARDIIALELS